MDEETQVRFMWVIDAIRSGQVEVALLDTELDGRPQPCIAFIGEDEDGNEVAIVPVALLVDDAMADRLTMDGQHPTPTIAQMDTASDLTLE